jgi:hypothetical protein
MIVVVSGNSVARGEGSTAGHTPAEQLSLALAAAGRTATVFNEAVNGQDIDYFIANFSSQVTPHYVASRFNIAIMLETAIYVDDTLGAMGTGLSLNDPTAAGVANYDKHVTWAGIASAAGFNPIVVCAPDLVEPSSYADAAANALYRQARDHSYTLMLADTAHFYRVVNARARSEFSDPWSLTYYQNAGEGERIHLTDAGYDLLGGQVFFGGIP